MDLIVTVHYSKFDHEFVSDYCCITIVLDGVLVATYGDFSQQGMSKARGWVDCYETLRPNLANVTWKNEADYDD